MTKTLATLAILASIITAPAAGAAPFGPLCPQGEDDNGRLTQNCQMWIAGNTGDDNHDGVISESESGWTDVYQRAQARNRAAQARNGSAIEEDDPRWDCRTMGNRECGPGNAQGVPPGDYGEIDYEAHTDWLIDTNEGRG